MKSIRNLKIFKNKVKLLSVGLAGMILLSGCGKDESINAYYAPAPSTSYSQSSEPTVSKLREPDEYVEASLEGIPIYADELEVGEFKNYLKGIKTEYPLSELYGINEALAHQSYDQNVAHTNDIRDQNGMITSARLFEMIKKNNDVYWDSGNIMTSFYDKMPDSEIKAVCDIIVEYVNKKLETDPSIDVSRVSCKLSNLKMYYKATSSNAYISTDDCFIISPNMLEVVQMIEGDQDVKRDTFIHETMHLIQDACLDQHHEEDKVTGICSEYHDLDVNPLYWKWFIEASAEKSMVNITGDDPIVYEYQIGYLESLSLATIFDDDVKVRQTENLCFQNDMNKLFEQFNCETDEEKQEIIKMMYAIDIIQTEREDFLEKYAETYGKEMTADELVEYKRVIKGSLSETLAKHFYANLSSKLSSGEMTMQDAFYLIKVFEADAFSHINYDNDAKKKSAMPFMQTYTEIQDSFFQLIAGEQYTQEEVEMMFSEYSMRVYQGDVKKERNCDLVWLDSDKQQYLFERSDAVYSSTIESIRNAYLLTDDLQY